MGGEGVSVGTGVSVGGSGTGFDVGKGVTVGTTVGKDWVGVGTNVSVGVRLGLGVAVAEGVGETIIVGSITGVIVWKRLNVGVDVGEVCVGPVARATKPIQ